MNRPRVQVLLDDIELAPDVRDVLQQIGADACVRPLRSAHSSPASPPVDARLVLTSNARALKNGKLSGFLEWFDRQPCQTLILSLTGADSGSSLEGQIQDRPIRFAVFASKDHLLGELQAMCGLSRSYDALRRELAELKRKDETLLAGMRQLQEELRQAGLLQRDLFQSNLPVMEGAQLHAWHRSASEVSGDVYHVTRLDGQTVGIAVADATGHGLAAGMLSVAIQRSIRDCSRMSLSGKSPAPADVLARLNHEILDAKLGECQFVTTVYAVYHEPTRMVHWARAGAPYPVLVRRGQSPRPIASEGMLLGVCRDRSFEPVRLELQPGDTLLFFTDGLESILCESLGEAAASLHTTPWFQRMGQNALERSLAELDGHSQAACAANREKDDVTVVALHLPTTLPSTSDRKHRLKARVHSTAS